MSTSECPLCSRPARGATICPECTSRLEADLRDVIVELFHQLEMQLSRQTSGVPRVRGRRDKDGDSTPLPYDPRATKARDELAAALWRWIGRLFPDALVGNRIDAMAGYLLARIRDVRKHQLAADAWEAITQAVDGARRAIDPRGPQRIYAGPCDKCKNDLLVDQGAIQVKCSKCGELHDVEKRRKRLLAEVEACVATAAEIARILKWLTGAGLASRRIRVWAHRGRLVPKQHDPGGNPMYLVRDVLDVLKAHPS